MTSPWSASSKYRASKGALQLLSSKYRISNGALQLLQLLWSLWSNVLKPFALFLSDCFCVKDIKSRVLWSGLVILILRRFLLANLSYSTLLIFFKSWYMDNLPVINSSWVMLCLKSLFLLHAHSLVLKCFCLCGFHQLGTPRSPSRVICS